MSVPVFEVQDVTFHYHRVTALDGLSLAIERGKRVALLGANGSGKSTLLRILDGLAFPVKGSVLFDGEPLTEDRLQDLEFGFQFHRRVGLVFQFLTKWLLARCSFAGPNRRSAVRLAKCWTS